jgi:hypothetical protein
MPTFHELKRRLLVGTKEGGQLDLGEEICF